MARTRRHLAADSVIPDLDAPQPTNTLPTQQSGGTLIGGTQTIQAPQMQPVAPAGVHGSMDYELQRERDELRLRSLEAQQQVDQLRQANLDYEHKLAEQAKQVEEAKALLAQAQQRADEIERQRLSQVDLDNLEYFEADAAREIQERLLTPVLNQYNTQITQLRSQLDEANARYEKQMADMKASRQQEQLAKVNADIRSKFPNVDAMVREPEYSEFMSRVIPGTRTTYGEQVAAAYNDGDVEYVTQMLTQYTENRPTLEGIASPQINPVASSPAAPVGEQFSYDDLSNWRYQFNAGDLTREEYSARIKAFEAAQIDGRVQ